jgi:hypothetical protein
MMTMMIMMMLERYTVATGSSLPTGHNNRSILKGLLLSAFLCVWTVHAESWDHRYARGEPVAWYVGKVRVVGCRAILM